VAGLALERKQVEERGLLVSATRFARERDDAAGPDDSACFVVCRIEGDSLRSVSKFVISVELGKVEALFIPLCRRSDDRHQCSGKIGREDVQCTLPIGIQGLRQY
jgi:hypothetical protein